MDRIEVESLNGEPVDLEMLDLIDDLNYWDDEGFISVEEGEDGQIRLFPETDEHPADY